MPIKRNGRQPSDVERFEQHIRASIRDFQHQCYDTMRDRIEALRPSEAAYVAVEMCIRVGRERPDDAARLIVWFRMFAACEAHEARDRAS